MTPDSVEVLATHTFSDLDPALLARYFDNLPAVYACFTR